MRISLPQPRTIDDVKSPAAWGNAAYRTVVGRVPRPGGVIYDAKYI